MNEQVDANKVIESLLRQIVDYAQKVAILEAHIATRTGEPNDQTELASRDNEH